MLTAVAVRKWDRLAARTPTAGGVFTPRLAVKKVPHAPLRKRARPQEERPWHYSRGRRVRVRDGIDVGAGAGAAAGTSAVIDETDLFLLVFASQCEAALFAVAPP